MLQTLKNIDPTRFELESLILWSAQATVLTNEYIGLGLDIPEWLHQSADRIRSTVKVLVQDEKKVKLQAAKKRLAALRSEKEKRKEIEAEIAYLSQQL